MRRLGMSVLAGVFVVALLLSGHDTAIVQGFAATPDAATKGIELALLMPAAKCAAVCFWTLQPGKVTLREFNKADQADMTVNS